jgi:hypothetical protein
MRPARFTGFSLGEHSNSKRVQALAYSSCIIFNNCGEVNESQINMFPLAKTAIFHNCNRYFVSKWLSPYKFPSITGVFLNSHPHQDTTLEKFLWQDHYIPPMFVHERWKIFIDQWANPNFSPHVKLITDEEYKRVLKSFDAADLVDEPVYHGRETDKPTKME